MTSSSTVDTGCLINREQVRDHTPSLNSLHCGSDSRFPPQLGRPSPTRCYLHRIVATQLRNKQLPLNGYSVTCRTVRWSFLDWHDRCWLDSVCQRHWRSRTGHRKAKMQQITSRKRDSFKKDSAYTHLLDGVWYVGCLFQIGSILIDSIEMNMENQLVSTRPSRAKHTHTVGLQYVSSLTLYTVCLQREFCQRERERNLITVHDRNRIPIYRLLALLLSTSMHQ